jgi:Tfp pilus assembly protein PilO
MPPQINKYFLIVVSLIVIVGVPVGIIYPSMQNIQKLSQSIIDEYKYLNERNLRGFYIKTLRQEYEGLIKSAPQLQQLELAAGSELDFIIQIEKLADDNGVKEKLQLQPDNSKKTEATTRIPFTLTTTGAHENNLKFLQQLQGLPLVVVIERLRLAAIPAGPGNPTANQEITYNLSGYFTERAQN